MVLIHQFQMYHNVLDLHVMNSLMQSLHLDMVVIKNVQKKINIIMV